MRKRLGHGAAIALLMLGSMAEPLPAQTLGTISVEAKTIDPDLRAAIPVFVEAVGKALADKGFTTLEGTGHASLAADLSLSRVQVGTTTAKVSVAPADISPGGSPSRVGGGVSVSLPTAKVRTVPLQQTRLEIRIRKRGEDNIIWHGAALTVRAAYTREGADEAVSSDLTKALFQAYPAQSEGVISIP